MDKNKKKLVYVSGEDFFDVDFPVLKILNKHFDLLWIPVLRIDGWYTQADVESYAKDNSISILPVVQKFKYKDPRMLKLYVSLLQSIRKQKPDIIYFEYFGVPFLHYLTPFFLPKEKIVFAIHDVKQHYKMEYGGLKARYFESLFKRFNNFHVFSQTQLSLFKSKYPHKNSFVANLCLKDFGKPTNAIKHTDKVQFLFFGIIRKNKGLDIIIEAVNNLSKKRKDFSVVIAGNAKDWQEYEQKIADKSFYEFHIRKIKNAEIPDFFASAHYILLPYIDVTQSGVLLTSYNYNIPAIASDLPGFNEYIIDGETGYLVVPESKDLAIKMEYVLDNHSERYAQMCNDLKEYVNKNINAENIVSNYISFFNTL